MKVLVGIVTPEKDLSVTTTTFEIHMPKKTLVGDLINAMVAMHIQTKEANTFIRANSDLDVDEFVATITLEAWKTLQKGGELRVDIVASIKK